MKERMRKLVCFEKEQNTEGDPGYFSGPIRKSETFKTGKCWREIRDTDTGAVTLRVIIYRNLRETNWSNLLRFISEKSKNSYAVLRHMIPVRGRMQIKATWSILGASAAQLRENTELNPVRLGSMVFC